MQNNKLTPHQFWSQMDKRIEHWLEARQLLLVKYCELSELHEFNGDNPYQSSQLQKFCEQTVDYISEGHFEIFEQLLSEGNLFSDDKGLAIGDDLLPTIHSHTAAILDFNDKYLATDDLSALAADLSSLGETLAQRFEIEDKMVAVLHSSHHQQILEDS
ncbi:MAG: sigma D regulator [Porticoccaceae bacterium]|nr:sigma D regulator [Porticoccaceae bacterium]